MSDCRYLKNGYCNHSHGEKLSCSAIVPCFSKMSVVTVESHGGSSKYRLDEDGIDGIFQYLEVYGEVVG